MKIIDLLNKIANDEEIPKKIKYKNKIWYYKEGIKEYISNDTFYSLNFELDELNDKAEILEKKIPEKLDCKYINSYGNISQHKKSEEPIINKINEILDYLESKGE